MKKKDAPSRELGWTIKDPSKENLSLSKIN
jgi:hypothetical protein